ncbi:peptide deformylase, partial [Stenotrophomonas maltophilia]|uniref:peptide deformylase n=1 Tax=Stenotrophomonas maltophilia TaxID=40324 RepID=UPI00281146F5
MALLPILEFPDPRLRTKAALIEAAEVTTPAFQELIDNMFLTMYDAPGIGLATSAKRGSSEGHGSRRPSPAPSTS